MIRRRRTSSVFGRGTSGRAVQGQLSEILEHFEALRALDTEGVPPTSHPLPLESVMRPDEVQPSLSTEDVLANAPQADEDAFRVRAILDE